MARLPVGIVGGWDGWVVTHHHRGSSRGRGVDEGRGQRHGRGLLWCLPGGGSRAIPKRNLQVKEHQAVKSICKITER
jgi:hypothetical protein